MEALSFTIAGDGSLHIHVDGHLKAVKSDAPNYDEVMTALRERRWEDVADLLQPGKAIDEAGNGMFRVVHGIVMVTDDDGEEFEVPRLLGDEILRYNELGLDFDRLILFAKNLNENPSYSSVQQLFGWIKQSNLTLTEDGCFIAYKGVKEDWTDCHTGKMDNSVGTIVKMKRNQVDENPSQSCSRGLHVATYDYAHNHYGSGASDQKHTVVVKVHPKNVVAVPNYENTKMRVCEYEVLEESEGGKIESPTYEDREQYQESTCDECFQYVSDCVCDEFDCHNCEDMGCDECE